jgi:DNA-directed RNA polymerase alpha subunit|tara:strand:+ start:381 stop:881 length:501 start_codon:yes stop_codon:yes gene_type:complete
METVSELYDRLGRISVRLRESGMTLREVGEIMETSPENVRRRYLRAKMRERYNIRPSTELELLERENRWAAFFASPNTVDLSLDDLGVSERPRNCLRRCRVDTVTQLLARTEDDLMAVTNFGQKSLDEVVDRLRERGLALRPRVHQAGTRHLISAPINWRARVDVS